VFTASDSSDPTKNGRRYAVTLDPERMCGQALWLYPGDTTEVAVDPASLAMASALSLRGAALVGDPAGKQITARLELDGRLALEAAVEVGQLAAGVELPLTAPGPARRVVLTLRNPPEGAFLLFTGASLRGEASVMEGGAGAVAEALVVAEAQAVAQAPAAAVAPPSRGAPPPASAARSLGIDLSVIRQDPKDLRKLALYETKPGDSAWSSVTGPLGPGLRLEASNPEGASRLCTGRFRVQGSGDARVHVSVPTLTNGEGKNRTLTFEVSWFDSSGPILANGKPARAAVNLAAGGWRWEAVPMTPPAGADHAQLCLRFAKSTGAFEVDGLEAGGL
jgi:hypothetical protein